MVAAANWASTEFSRISNEHFRGVTKTDYSAKQLSELTDYSLSNLSPGANDLSSFVYFLTHFAKISPRVDQALLTLAESSAPVRAKWLAMPAIARVGNADAADLVGKLAISSDPNMQVCAIDVLPLLGKAGRKYLPAIKEIATDNVPARRVQYFAHQTLSVMDAGWSKPPKLGCSARQHLYRYSEDYDLDAFLLELEVQLLTDLSSYKSLTAIQLSPVFEEVVLPSLDRAVAEFCYENRGRDRSAIIDVSHDMITDFLIRMVTKRKLGRPVENRKTLGTWGKWYVKKRLQRHFAKLDKELEYSENIVEAKTASSGGDDLTDRVVQLVEALPELEQRMVALRFKEGLSNREIGQIIGCSVESARVRLHRIRQKIWEGLQPSSEA